MNKSRDDSNPLIGTQGRLDLRSNLTIFFLLILISFGLIIKVGLITSTSYDIRGVESNVLFSIQEIMVGDELYPDPELPPFPITQYTPLYYILTAKISSLLNISPGTGFSEIFIVGRLFSFLLSIGLSLVIYFACRKFGADILVSSIGAVSSFLVPTPWYSLLRPDALMALTGVGAIVVYSFFLLSKNQTKSNYLLLIVGSLGFLSFLTKQNGAIFLVSIILFAVLRFRFKEIFYMLAGAGIVLVITSLIFSKIYSFLPADTNYFYFHVIGGLDNGIDLGTAYIKLYSVLLKWYLPLALFPYGLAIMSLGSMIGFGQQDEDDVNLFLAVSFLIVTTSNLVAGIKFGSAIHYVNESMLIAILFLVRYGIQNKKIFQNNKMKHQNLLLVGYLIYLSILSTHLAIQYRGSLENSRLIQNSDMVCCEAFVAQFQEELQTHPNALIFSTHYPIDFSLFDHIIFPQKDLANISFMRNVLDYSELTNLIEDGQLRYIVLKEDQKIPDKIFGNEIEGFELIHNTSDLNIYLNMRFP